MSSKESDIKSGSHSGLGTKNKEETKSFNMKKMPFYNPELLSKRKVIINTSTSKQMYSFPTSKRFNDYVKDESSFFYNIRTPFTKRSTSFGYGTKVVFTDNNKYPGPGSYNNLPYINSKGRYANSELPNSQQNKFGNELRFKSKTITNETPSPSSYSPETMIKGSGIIYNSRYKSNLGKSMGSRLGIIGEKLITPGPGSYDFMNMNKKGKYPSSILSNSILNSFSKDKRFKPVEDNGNPGPNAYRLESMIKGNGIMYNSRYNTNLGKSMGIKLNDLNKSITPGPGAYEFFSDFEGFYKYGKKKKGKNGEDEDKENEENEEDRENESENKSGDGSKVGSSDDSGKNSSNGKLLKEVFGKGVNEQINKVQIKKPKLK